MALDNLNGNELASHFFGAGLATSTSSFYWVSPGNHIPWFHLDLLGWMEVLVVAPHTFNFQAGRRYTIEISGNSLIGSVIDEGLIPQSVQ